MCPAIHITSRSWLRSSSTHEPSDPPLRVVSCLQTCYGPPFSVYRSPTVRCKDENWHEGATTGGRSLFEPSRAGGHVTRPPPAALSVRNRQRNGPGTPTRRNRVERAAVGSCSGLPTDRGSAVRSRVVTSVFAPPTGNDRRGHSVMILPQVHLRKPCYDFYFL